MSYSLKSGKAETLAWFQSNQSTIKTVVDIGPGSGTYVKLIKEDAQCCANATWIGIEIWKPYIEEFNLESRYNQILNQDVRTVDWTVLNPDVVIAGDVLEHMTKEESQQLVNTALQHSKYILISIPVKHMPQDAVDGNPFEVHVKDNWTHQEVIESFPNIISSSATKKIGVYWLKANVL
jgi:cyclopropane fatty-acyl-phospholipid synthase-like methyltransferase